MPITYRQHLDSRDGTIYNCVLMPDGKWWSAENLAWAGAGLAYTTEANTLAFGRLYDYPSALAYVPAGSHLPTESEWVALQSAIPDPDGKKLKANNSRWNNNTGTDNYGFHGMPGGTHNGSFANLIFGIGDGGEFWTATPSGANAKAKILSANGDLVYDANRPQTDYRLSVRFIVDTFNEPHYIKLFDVNFDGFERGMTVSIQRPIQVIDSIGGSVKLIPYGPAELDEWRVETELWVKGEWAAELEAAVPPYGVPQTTDMYLPPRSSFASFPGLRPALAGSNADKYIHPQVTRFESQGRKGPIVDLFGYFMDFTLRAWADGQATNQASTPTTTLPTWLAQKFAARQIQDWSVQTATVSSGGFRPTYLRSKHGRRKDVNFNLDHLTAAQANELVAFFRGVRHNVTTITCDNGPDGQQAVSVYLVGLKLHRTGLHWDGTLETVLA